MLLRLTRDSHGIPGVYISTAVIPGPIVYYCSELLLIHHTCNYIRDVHAIRFSLTLRGLFLVCLLGLLRLAWPVILDLLGGRLYAGFYSWWRHFGRYGCLGRLGCGPFQHIPRFADPLSNNWYASNIA